MSSTAWRSIRDIWLLNLHLYTVCNLKQYCVVPEVPQRIITHMQVNIQVRDPSWLCSLKQGYKINLGPQLLHIYYCSRPNVLVKAKCVGVRLEQSNCTLKKSWLPMCMLLRTVGFMNYLGELSLMKTHKTILYRCFDNWLVCKHIILAIMLRPVWIPREINN